MQTEESFRLDLKEARLRRNRAAKSFSAAGSLFQPLAEQSLERLDLCKIEPRRVLAIGNPTDFMFRALQRRYPQAEVYVFDRAVKLLHTMEPERRFMFRAHRSLVCAELPKLPLAPACIDVIVCDLELSWTNDLDRSLVNLCQTLTPGGLLMFTALGPDTLLELRQCWQADAAAVHLHSHLDMHDLGDALIRAGFASPVLDVTRYVLTYADLRSLRSELRTLGATNVATLRRRTLTGKQRFASMARAYERLRQHGRVPVTIELVCGHAWVKTPEERPQDGSTVAAFPFESLRQSIRTRSGKS